jgi:hypothetical protein
MGDIRRQIADDRRNASAAAAVASLVSVLLLAISLFATYHSVMLMVSYRSVVGMRGYAYVAAALLGTLLSLALVRWTYRSARDAAMRQRIQAMWLRRFQRETGDAFRTSRVIDQLSGFGISTLTLQDRDVQVSFAQRRNRAMSIVWRVLTPLIGLLVVVGGFVVYVFWHRDLDDWQSGLGGVILLLGFIVGALGLLLVGAAVAMLLAAVNGPVQSFFAQNRDDYRRLPRLMDRIRIGRRTRGTEILRISEVHWREAVTMALSVVDVAIIDVSTWSDSLAWELDEVVRVCSPRSVVCICRGSFADLPPESAAVAAVRAGGVVSDQVICYPAAGNDPVAANRFATALRERIYSAVDTL